VQVKNMINDLGKVNYLVLWLTGESAGQQAAAGRLVLSGRDQKVARRTSCRGGRRMTLLDASAVLALIQDEPGGDVVAAALPGSRLGERAGLQRLVVELCGSRRRVGSMLI
jgi:hypothetical protein